MDSADSSRILNESMKVNLILFNSLFKTFQILVTIPEQTNPTVFNCTVCDGVRVAIKNA